MLLALTGLMLSALLLADLPIDGGVLYVGAWAVFGASLVGKPSSHYRRRLWPSGQLAA